MILHIQRKILHQFLQLMLLVRDKDSFQATLLLAEVASYYKEQGKTLIQVLEDLFDETHYKPSKQKNARAF